MEQETVSRTHYHCSGQYMFIMDKYYRQYLRDALKPFTLSATEGMAILSLQSHHLTYPSQEGYTQEELNESLRYDKAALTRAMKQLETSGYVQRKPNHTDKRSSWFRLTQKGKDMFPILIAILQKWEDDLFAGISPEEKTAFENTIIKVAENAGTAAQRYRLENTTESE